MYFCIVCIFFNVVFIIDVIEGWKDIVSIVKQCELKFMWGI